MPVHASRLLSLALLAAFVLLLPGCPEKPATCLYCTEPIAPSLDEAAIRNLDHLGPTLIDAGVNFSVFAGNADRIDLLIFNDPESTLPTRQFEMVRFGDVWNLHVQGIGEGQHYGFVAWGPNWPTHPDWFPGSIHGFVADVDPMGHRYNPNKLLLDPYSRMAHRDHDWSKASLATGPARTQSTYAAGAKSVVVKSKYQWSEHEATWRENRKNPDWEGHRWQDLVFYEVHPKGFTADPASGVEHPGTFRGVGEKAAYLADLGINAVELLPVMEKPLDGGYWGYNNVLFFAPEVSYAAAKRPEEIVDEFKWMVDQLHQHGIEVILDVVYNHTGEGGLWREKIQQSGVDLDPNTTGATNFLPKEVVGLYDFRGLDNLSYYELCTTERCWQEGDDKGFYVNVTGVGNTTRVNYRPMRRLVMDNLRFWVEEMHVDGFRFDLAVVLGDQDRVGSWKWDPVAGHVDVTDTVLQELLDDPVMREHNVRMISEPWAIHGYHLGNFPRATEHQDGALGFYEWNGNFRDFWRSYMNEDHHPSNAKVGEVDLGGTLTGSYDIFGGRDGQPRWNARRPYHSVNFLTVHDGFTLYDLFSYAEKQNGCSMLNPICCDDFWSPFCDPDTGEDENRSRIWSDEAEKRQLIRNSFVAMAVAHGSPLILGGDEWMRTQLGNNNAFSHYADNEYNWYMWGSYVADPARVRMHDFVRNVLRFRKERAYAFAPASYEDTASFKWKDAGGGTNPDWSARHMAQHYDDPAAGPELYILINMELGQVDFTLPAGRTWRRLIDTQAWFESDAWFTEAGAPRNRSSNVTLDAPELITGGSYGVPSRTIVVLEAAN